jgi:ATP-binding cassette, subfamily B, bacterial MsbA
LNDVASRTPQAVPGAWDTYRRLLGYLRPYKLGFGIGLSGAIIFAISAASFPRAANYLGDFLSHPDPGMVVWLPVALVLIFVARGLGDFVQT